MAYRACVIDRVYVLRWTAEPLMGDVAAIVNAVTAARRTVGRPVLYLGIIGAEIPLPKSAVRDALSNSLRPLSELCDCIDLLIVDTDIRSILIRTVARAMALAAPGRNLHVFGSAEHLASDWRRNYQVDALAMLERFRVFEQAKVA
jgi:hypothetical protein